MNNQNDKAKVNKVAVILFTVLGSILFLAYVIEVVKQSKTVGQVAILGATDLIPIIVCWIIKKINPGSDAIKHVMAIGYGMFYLATIFITNERLVFVYAMPMLIIVMMYNDIRFSILISTICSILAAFHAVRYSSASGWTTEDIAQTEIEVLVMIVMSIFIILCCKTLTEINRRKLEAVDESAQKTQGVLDKVIVVSKEMVDAVEGISEKMEKLAISSDETLNAMEEISSGSAETADSVQNQIYKTEEIQVQIQKVENASDDISSNVDKAVDTISEGRENLENLMKQSVVSENASNGVVKEVEELVKSIGQMQSIVDLINSVASQTSLLALNASIEAARAGEAGRGFAVVSTEISSLANQTQSATSSISTMINSLMKEMKDVTDAINVLIESNKSQNESALVTSESFEKIVAITDLIRSSSKELTGSVASLADANSEIVDNIQTISAITEEFSAHASTTRDGSEISKSVVAETLELVDSLSANVSVLRELQ